MNIYTATFLVLLCLVVFYTFVLYKNVTKSGEKKDNKDIILDMAVDAMFIALILIMNFVPNLGFIAIGSFISFTLLHIPVLLGAATGGIRRGVLLGLAFGISSCVQATQTGGGLNFYFIYPWISILPRVLFGFFAGLTFSLLGKVEKKKKYGLYLCCACVALTILHTLLVFGALLIFFGSEIWPLLTSSNPVASTTALTFAGIIGIGAAGEAVLAGVLVPAIYLALKKAVPNLFRNRKVRR
ncbi:MAG: ECF transporter S component [Bacilli bacterium]|nr:ECF transporter S component [Bacilli bacterium]MDY6430890.1 ECF transporter S component [Bacilli bacterium]